jgi:hypothetical protein
MQAISNRYNFFFRSTKGLVLVAIALISLVTAIWGMLSGPMAELGIRDVVVNALGMSLKPIEREGRIILLYHSIAMAVVAIETYFITALVKMKSFYRAMINATITVGYICALVFGLLFGYFGHNWIFHGLFMFGLALVFFAGVMLAVALWPWDKDYLVPSNEYSHLPGGVDLERVAFFVMAIATLGSVLFGAIPGSFYGNGFETFLAEEVVREPDKGALQLAVIGHLHIMLALIAVALMLILSRWTDCKGILHKIATPLTIIGTIIMTVGVWLVVPFEAIAHVIINVGSGPILISSCLLVAYAWRKQISERLAAQGITQASFGQKFAALLHDPIKFGAYWQMIFMNIVVTFVGIFMAIKLDAIIRVWPLREEQITLTGHWHILSGIIATIILLYYANLAGIQGKTRQWFGWLVVLASDVAFIAVSIFEIKRLFVVESAQQPLVDITILVADVSLATVLIVLATLMVWRLADLFKSKGRWKRELDEAPEVAE